MLNLHCTTDKSVYEWAIWGIHKSANNKFITIYSLKNLMRRVCYWEKTKQTHGGGSMSSSVKVYTLVNWYQIHCSNMTIGANFWHQCFCTSGSCFLFARKKMRSPNLDVNLNFRREWADLNCIAASRAIVKAT